MTVQILLTAKAAALGHINPPVLQQPRPAAISTGADPVEPTSGSDRQTRSQTATGVPDTDGKEAEVTTIPVTTDPSAPTTVVNAVQVVNAEPLVDLDGRIASTVKDAINAAVAPLYEYISTLHQALVKAAAANAAAHEHSRRFTTDLAVRRNRSDDLLFDQICLSSRVTRNLLTHDERLTALATRLDHNHSGVSTGGPLFSLDGCRSLCDIATVFLKQYHQCSANDDLYDMLAKEPCGIFKSPLRRRIVRKDKALPEGKKPSGEKKKDEESPKDRHKANPNDRKKAADVPATVPGPHSRSGIDDIQKAESLDVRRSMRAGFVQGTVSCLGCGSIRHMLRLCPHVSEDERSKIWNKWQEQSSAHRLLVKKYKKGGSAEDLTLLGTTQKAWSRSLDKAFAALRVKYNTQSAHFTHEQHALEDKAAGISEQLATYVSQDAFRTSSAAVAEATRLHDAVVYETQPAAPAPAPISAPAAAPAMVPEPQPANADVPSCITMVQTPMLQPPQPTPVQLSGSSALAAQGQPRPSGHLAYPRPLLHDPSSFQQQPVPTTYGYSNAPPAAAMALTTQAPQHAVPSSGNGSFASVPAHVKQAFQQKYLSELAEYEATHSAAGHQQHQYVQHATGAYTGKPSRQGAPLVETDAKGSVYGAGLKTQQEFRSDTHSYDQVLLNNLSSKTEFVEKECEGPFRTIGYVCSRSSCPCTTSMGNCENSYCCWTCQQGTPCDSNFHRRTPEVEAPDFPPGLPPAIHRVHDHWPHNASGRNHNATFFHVKCKEYAASSSSSHEHQYMVHGNCTIVQLIAFRYVVPADAQECTQRVRCLMQGYQENTFATHLLDLNTRIDVLVKSIEDSHNCLPHGAGLGTVPTLEFQHLGPGGSDDFPPRQDAAPDGEPWTSRANIPL